jgi:hypothetical protein
MLQWMVKGRAMEITELLRSLLQGELSSAELPEAIELGAMGATLDEMYRQSAEDSRERAALIIMDQTGAVRLGPITVGEERHTTLDAIHDARTLGTIHTHPPLGGATGVAFGAGDIATMINDGDVFSMVQSGRNLIALIRTEKTVVEVALNEVRDKMTSLCKIALTRSLSRQAALLEANLTLCQEYGLAFYAGYAPGPIKGVFKS